MNKPLVSICTLVYNHESYLRECLEGIMMQRTDFTFELLIHDDASTDGSADIIREYEAKYPDIVKPIYQTENQYSKGVKVSTVFQFPRAKGKYIAMCEGDDYWTDPDKLQKQIDFLEEHEEYSLCVSQYNYEYRNRIEENRNVLGRTIDKEKIIEAGGGFFATASMVYRHNVVIDMPAFVKRAPVGDYYLTLLCLAKGRVYCLEKKTCVYRKDVVGAWSSLQRSEKWYQDFYNKSLMSLNGFNEFTNNEYLLSVNIIKKKIFGNYIRRVAYSNKRKAMRILILNFYKLRLIDLFVIIKRVFLNRMEKN